MLNKMKKEQEQNRKVCGKSYCTDYLDYIYVRPDGKADSARFPEPAFPGFSGRTPNEAYPFHDLRQLRQSALCQWREPEGNSGVARAQVTSARPATFIPIWIFPAKVSSANAIVSIFPENTKV